MGKSDEKQTEKALTPNLYCRLSDSYCPSSQSLHFFSIVLGHAPCVIRMFFSERSNADVTITAGNLNQWSSRTLITLKRCSEKLKRVYEFLEDAFIKDFVMTGQGARCRTRGNSRNVVFYSIEGRKPENQYNQSRTRGTRIVGQKRVR